MIEFFCGSYFEAMNIRNLLETNGIKVFVVNEYTSSLVPWIVTAGGSNATILKINELDSKIAEEIIESYNNID